MPVADEMQVTDIGMQPESGDQRIEVVEEQRIAQTQQAIDRISRRLAGAMRESKGRIDKLAESSKILCRSRAFVPVDLFHGRSVCQTDVDLTQPVNGCSHNRELFAALVALEKQAAVMQLGANNHFSGGQAKFRVTRSDKLLLVKANVVTQRGIDDAVITAP